MSWYWWVLVIILALNGFLIGLIALALALSWWRKSRAAREERRKESGAGTAP